MASSEPIESLVPAVTAALASGQAPPREPFAALAATTDVLALGALADDLRRARHGLTTTFARVHEIDVTAPEPWPALPLAATEVRVVGRPETIDAAVAAVRRVRALAGDRVMRGFWLADLAALGAESFGALRAAGLDEVAFVAPALDAVDLVRRAREAGLGVGVIAVDQSAPGRLEWLVDARRFADAVGGIAAVAPLPRQLDRTTPTTGFDDVRTVALARLVIGDVSHVQVDWARYGPKLAQVALSVGADDLDGVSPIDDPSLGPRRAAAEDVRRNIVSAGLTPVERDGRWTAIGR
jgi:hypothetical protein